MTGSNRPACAACKFQRRKCGTHCSLAPYFPASKTEDFNKVHRLYGVSNVTYRLLALKTQTERDDLMKSIITEAHIRTISPVHGCTAVIVDLFRQLALAVQELNLVKRQIEACKDLLNPGQAPGSNPETGAHYSDYLQVPGIDVPGSGQGMAVPPAFGPDGASSSNFAVGSDYLIREMEARRVIGSNLASSSGVNAPLEAELENVEQFWMDDSGTFDDTFKF